MAIRTQPKGVLPEILSAHHCAETGGFRLWFGLGRLEIAADLTVCWLEEKGLAYLRFVTVDHVLDADRASERAIEAWVAANEEQVFSAALKVAP